jgi:hypothetical protein
MEIPLQTCALPPILAWATALLGQADAGGPAGTGALEMSGKSLSDPGEVGPRTARRACPAKVAYPAREGEAPPRRRLRQGESAMRTSLIVVASAAALFAQNEPPNIRHIVELSIAATERNWQARNHYTYIEVDEDQRLDSRGLVQSADVDVSTIVLVNGAPFERLMKHNGMPPSASEQRKQEVDLGKLRRETPEERAERLHEDREDSSFIREVPLGFDFQLVGEEAVNGRPAYVVQSTPHPGYRPHGKYGKMFLGVEGKLWIDKQDFGWVKVDGQVIQPISLGLFLARVQRGSHIMMDQVRVGEGIWMPKRIEVRVRAKVLFVMSYDMDKILTYSEYLPAQQAPLVSLNSRQPASR